MRRNEVQDLIGRMEAPGSWSTGLKPEALPLLKRWVNNLAVLPLSSIVGTAELGVPINASEIVHEFGGPVNDSDRGEHSNWAWPMLKVEPLEPFLPAKGAQGFWDWSGQ